MAYVLLMQYLEIGCLTADMHDGGIVRNQQTLAAAVTCSGVGLHSGQPVTIMLRPAPPDTGVVFVNQKGDSTASLTASVEYCVPT